MSITGTSAIVFKEETIESAISKIKNGTSGIKNADLSGRRQNAIIYNKITIKQKIFNRRLDIVRSCNPFSFRLCHALTIQIPRAIKPTMPHTPIVPL